jgi:hypothetical protein
MEKAGDKTVRGRAANVERVLNALARRGVSIDENGVSYIKRRPER